MDFIREFWFAMLLAIIAFTVWLIRLEGKVKLLGEKINTDECDILDLKRANKEEIKDITGKLDSMNIKLTELCISFAELAGYMKRCREEDK
jgi:hypothetical protein